MQVPSGRVYVYAGESCSTEGGNCYIAARVVCGVCILSFCCSGNFFCKGRIFRKCDDIPGIFDEGCRAHW